MKNVFLILMLFGGFAISGLQAQNCHPCPPCPACPKGCCAFGSKAASASAQIMPATLDIFAAYSPEAKSTCQSGKNVANKEMKACQPSCTSGSTASCQSAAANTFQPSAMAMNDKPQPAAKPEKN